MKRRLSRVFSRAMGFPWDQDARPPGAERRNIPKSIRFQLLATVNSTMAVLVIAFLMLDYQRELDNRLEQKQVALQEEAKTILPAVLHLRREGTEPVQEYLDAVCGRMRDAQSPGHHIAVRLGETVLQATAHRRSSPEIFHAIEQASKSNERRVEFRNQELIVGSARFAGVTIYVSENLGMLRRSVLGHLLWHLAEIFLLGVVAAFVVSAVLLRIIAQPLHRLATTVHQVTVGNLAARSSSFNSMELADLSEAINAMSVSLEAADQERRGEMAKARQIQQHLLPTATEIPGLSLSALYQPATEVAGDYYDLAQLPDESWLVCVADVCGHGVPAAMSAAMLKAFLMHAIEHHVAPHELLAFVNQRFATVSPTGMFASMLLVRWDPHHQNLQYASAGHEPGWCVSADGGTRMVEATGLPLGIDVEASWTTETLEISPGDRLLLITDGVTETFNPQKELFGRNRLGQLLVQYQDEPLEELRERIDDALVQYRDGTSATDDTTLVIVEFAHTRRPRASSQLPRSPGVLGIERHAG